MKNKLNIVSVLIISVILIPQIALASWWNPLTWKIFNKKNIRSELIKEQKDKTDILLKELSLKYNANIDWNKDIDYTLELQNKLVTANPIIFTGYIDDIFNKNEIPFVKLSNNNYIFEISCNKNKIEELLNNKKVRNKYVVVANIKEVIRPFFKLGSYLTNEVKEGQEPIIEIDNYSSDKFIIQGACVDIVKIDR